MQWKGSKVVVVGLAKSGVAAARLLLRQGACVIGNDLRDETQLDADALALRELGAELALGGHDIELFRSADQIVVSPGVPALPALDAAAKAGIPIISEIGLAASFVRSTLIGITGTNGKSTVTSLVGDICASSGRPTFVGGNLGTPLVEVVGTAAAEPGGFVVVELSSFQLERSPGLHVHAAALLNVTDDHLDRYASFAAYADAKAGIFHNQTPHDAAVVPSDDPVCEQLARRGRATVHRFGGADGSVRIAADALTDSQSGLSVPLSEIALWGKHNHENACAATLLCRLGGVPMDAIAAGLRAFRGLPHRMQHVRTLDGVDYFDDSKGTNVGATVAALDGLCGRGGKVVLIAGGRDKGGVYTPLAERMAACGRAAVLIGEAAALIDSALSARGCAVQRAQDLQAAVTQARALAQPGDSVLLSPACSSFDMFRSYSERGDRFQQAVRELTGGTR